MFKIDIQELARPYLHIIFNICADTLTEAEILATGRLCKHYGNNQTRLVYTDGLSYAIYIGFELVGQCDIVMLD